MASNTKPQLSIINSLTFGLYFPEHLNQLSEHFEISHIHVPADCTPQDLLSKIRESEAIIASVTPQIPEAVIAEMSNLKIIARHGIGYDSVDVDACTRKGVLVTRVKGELERVAVAEQAIALMMSAARHINLTAIQLKQDGNWGVRKEALGYEISGKTVGVIGLGNIGSRSAEILKRGFDCNVLIYDPNLEPGIIETIGFKKVDLETLCKESLIILLHCDLNQSSKEILSEREFSLMQKGVLIVNTARGELINETALINNLDTNKIFCYATDVIAGEPVDNSNKIVRHPKTLVTPHIGNMTFESLKAMGDSMVQHVLGFCLNGLVPVEALNPQIARGLD